MSSLDTPLIVEVLPKNRSGQGLFRLTTPFEFDLSEFGYEGIITVPEGYVTDFASVPHLFRFIIPTSGNVAKPALLHDQMSRVSDKRATSVFNRALKKAGVFFLTRWMMVSFVFIFTFPDMYLFKHNGDK